MQRYLFHLQIAGQGRKGEMEKFNAPLAYLMGGIRTVGFEGWFRFWGFFFMFPIDKHCFSCSSSHGEELITFPPALPLHPSTGRCRGFSCWYFARADVGTCPSASRSSWAHIIPASHPKFWGRTHTVFPFCRLGVRVIIPITSAGLICFHCLWFSAFWEQWHWYTVKKGPYLSQVLFI